MVDTNVPSAKYFVVEYQDRTYSIKRGASANEVLDSFQDGFDIDRIEELHEFETERAAQEFADEEFEPHK